MPKEGTLQVVSCSGRDPAVGCGFTPVTPLSEPRLQLSPQKHGFDRVSPCTCGFFVAVVFSINSVKAFSLPDDFLDNSFSSLAVLRTQPMPGSSAQNKCVLTVCGVGWTSRQQAALGFKIWGRQLQVDFRRRGSTPRTPALFQGHP